MIVRFYHSCLILICVSAHTLYAQPDSNYFQQQVDFKINVKLNDKQHTLSGFETITYKNNSPHTLKYIYFHVWANAYKNNETAMAKQLLENGDITFYYAPESDRGFIDSLLFVAGKDTLKFENFKQKEKNGKPNEEGKETEYIDIVKVKLKKELLPDSTIIITTPFFVKIPDGKFSRLGHVGESYQISQWFPKPAVYDKNGWNQMPYLTQGEFYSEYGNYDVTITLPSNYLVAATGELTDCYDEERFLELKAKETAQLFKDLKVNKIGNLIGNDNFPPSDTRLKTLRYTIKNVHDFAFFADKRWHVLKGEYEFPKSGKLVSIWTFFTQGNSRYWNKSVQYIHDAIHYYSKWNGDYPYSIVQAVDGTISAGGGMEYPTVTVIGNATNNVMLENVIMHEVGHNWFYGILGSNERIHPWMDEGLNSANELRYMNTKYPELTIGEQSISDNLKKFMELDTTRNYMMYYLAYKLSASSNNDQPVEGLAKDYTPSNYAMIVYMKTAACFNFLKSYLGDEIYDKCFHAYYQAWKFKHPQPNDIRKIFEKISKKNLSWFFDELLGTTKVIDYKITKKKKPDTRSTATFGWMKYEEGVEIKNAGDIAAPFCVAGIKNDTIADLRWYQGFNGKYVVTFPNGNYDKIIVDPYFTSPEITHKNNTYKYKIKGKKLFARTEKLHLKFIGGYDHQQRSVLFFSPVVGYNQYDGVMLGAAFYNAVMFPKKVEFAVMPLFGLLSLKPAGSASIKINSHNRKSVWLKTTSFGLNAVNYSLPSIIGTKINVTNRFFRVDPFLNFQFKPKLARSPISQKISFRYIAVVESEKMKNKGSYDSSLVLVNTKTLNSFIDLNYLLTNKKTLMPHALGVNLRYGGDFAFATTDFTISRLLDVKKKKITLRLYAGAFLFNNSNNGRYNLRGDGIRGYNDYTYSQTFIGRNNIDGFWSHQFTEGFANLKAQTANGQSNKWNAGANLYCDLPIPFLKIFADVVFAESKKFENGSVKSYVQTVSDAGLYCSIGKGVLNLYLPLYISNAIKSEYNANSYTFSRRIRFSLNINQLAPHRTSNTIKLF